MRGAIRDHLRRSELEVLRERQLVASRAFTAPIGVSTGALRIGGNNIWPEWFKGQIDEVRIYSRALSAAEVALDRDTPIAP